MRRLHYACEYATGEVAAHLREEPRTGPRTMTPKEAVHAFTTRRVFWGWAWLAWSARRNAELPGLEP